MWLRMRIPLLLAVLLALLATSACIAPITPDPAAASQPTTEVPTDTLSLVIATGGTGGVFYPYGEGLARILSEKLPNTEATALETAGSVDNMKLIQSGKAQIGMSTVDSAYDAINGTSAYAESGPVPAMTIAVLYQSFLHVIARQDAGITTVADMAGKRISVGSAGSSTEIAANRVLEAAEIDPMTGIIRQELSVADSVIGLQEGSVDAFFWIGGLPTAAITDLTNTPRPCRNLYRYQPISTHIGGCVWPGLFRLCTAASHLCWFDSRRTRHWHWQYSLCQREHVRGDGQ